MKKENNLIIRIDETSVNLAEVSHFKDSIDVKDTTSHLFSSFSENVAKEELKDLLKKFSEHKNFDNTLVCWSTISQFLTPMKLFQESDLSSLATLVFGELDKNELDYNRLPEINMVAIYRIPIWVKSVFIQTFPMASIKSEAAMFARALSEKTTIKPKMYLRLFPNCASFMIVGNGLDGNSEAILFSNQYEYENVEDVLYFLLNILNNQKEKHKPEELILFIEDINSEKEVGKTSIAKLFESVKDFKDLTVSYKNDESLFKIYNQCV